MIKKIAWLSLVLVGLQGWSYASFDSTDKGTSAGSFLKLGAGARALAMGEAFTAVADDASSLYWNPAALTRVAKRSAIFMHGAHVESIFYDYGAYAQTFENMGSVGLAVQYLSAGSIEQVDDQGNSVGDFTPSDLAVSLGYAYKLEFLSVGIAGKFIRSKIIESDQTGAVDLGLLTPAYGDWVRLGLALSNLGGKLQYDQQSYSLPTVLKVGADFEIMPRWSAGLDLAFPKDNRPFAALGTEGIFFTYREMALSGRIGMNSRSLNEASDLGALSVGMGASMKSVSVDYAFVPHKSVGLAHRASVGFKF